MHSRNIAKTNFQKVELKHFSSHTSFLTAKEEYQRTEEQMIHRENTKVDKAMDHKLTGNCDVRLSTEQNADTIDGQPALINSFLSHARLNIQ